MTSSDLSQSLFLRKHPFSFIDGATGVFDWTPIIQRYNTVPTSENADARELSPILGDDLMDQAAAVWA